LKTILAVDDDKMILQIIAEALGPFSEDIKVLTAFDGKEAIEILNASQVDLVLTDLKMPEMDGYELLSFMTKQFRNIPAIVMTAYGSPEIARRLMQKGVADYIEKPFSIQDLREKIFDVFQARSKGYIHGFTLANFLQTVEVEQKTLTLHIRAKERTGSLHIEKGQLIDAETDEGLGGEAAAIDILCWDNTEIEIKGIHHRTRTIDLPLMHLLLDATKTKDEKNRQVDQTRDGDLLAEGIRLAEAHHFRDARERMARHLKLNPKSVQGWLWYARISVSVKTIESSLKNAALLDPKDRSVIDEVLIFKKALERLKGADQVRRCPFCWFPMETSAIQCASCKSHLFIHDRFFSSIGDADEAVLKKAVERYTRVIGREKNINAHYFLSMAHLNLENWEEALNMFHKTVQLAPDQDIFSEQLRILVNHMAMDATSKSFDLQEAPEPGLQPADAARKKKILVVEDSSTTRRVIAITLTQIGYEVTEACDGLEALSRLNDERPDLILLDIILPKMDGYKILSIIKSNALFKKIPVIMLTSRDGFMDKIKSKLSGSDAYLTKPFDPEMLIRTIQKYLPNRSE